MNCETERHCPQRSVGYEGDCQLRPILFAIAFISLADAASFGQQQTADVQDKRDWTAEGRGWLLKMIGRRYRPSWVLPKRKKMAAEAREMDVVRPDEQQSDADHNIRGEDTQAGDAYGSFHRSSRKAGGALA